jgi:hypothetical protein
MRTIGMDTITTKSHLPFSTADQFFDPANPHKRACEAKREVVNMDIPWETRRRILDLLDAVDMESWTKGYRTAAEYYAGKA